ncbi:MAG: RNAseH domain-containing protein [Nostocales cyanobacterium W4_Combined_metabat2_030]|nr:RNAseH domain-containing protein [Nostocales cyanobacterium W4_Combined_metabat2_030]
MTKKFSANMNEANNINEENDFDEVNALDEYEDEQILSDQFYIQIKNETISKSALAFSIPDKLEPVIVKGWTLTWTKPALKDLSTIQKATGNDDKSAVKNLPYVSLRGLMEIRLTNIARIQSNVGLSKYNLDSYQSEKLPEPFAYLTVESNGEIEKKLKPILNEWITNYLKPFADQINVPTETLENLKEMQEKGELIKIDGIEVQVLPWKWDKKTGTTKSKGNYDFTVLADYTARLIAGKEIFTGLGPMKRIISSSSNFTSGVAELITNPISIDDESGKFSLLLHLQVITFPGLHQPLLKIDVSKRRWLNDLKPANYNDNNITGFIFWDDYDDRAFTYTVFPQKEKKNSQQVTKGKKKKSQQSETASEKPQYSWVTGKDFEALRRELSLSTQAFNGQQIVAGEASTEKCQVLLTYKNGLQDDNHGIDAGVPEIDKLEAYEKIAQILKSIGMNPFDAYSPVKFTRGKAHSTQKKQDSETSRMINTPTLLEAILLADSNSSQNIASLSDSQLDALLREKFGINIGSILGERKSLNFNSKNPNQANELKLLIEENKAALARLYPKEKLRLFLFCEKQNNSDVKLLKEIAQLLYGESLEIIVNRLPENTHGPRINLPDSGFKPKKRSAKRIEAWQHISKQVADSEDRTFCLVMARDFYAEFNKPDDKVNKPSTRKALATDGRSCVQFILPIQKTRKDQKLILDNFFHRVQSSLKELLFAHSGRIDRVKEKVDTYLENTPVEKRPKEIIGITIVRKQSGRVRGEIGQTFLPVAIRIKLDTGICEMCCAYEKGNKLEIPQWLNFSDSLAFISKLSPIKLADKEDKRKTRFMEFVNQVISASVDSENQPLVIIDSTNCVQLWGWLADSRINANQINLGKQHENMQEDWEGARLIRIRQDIAPGIVEKKERWLVESSPEDPRTKEEIKKLSPSKKIPSATSPTGLFKLNPSNKTGCIVYISMNRREQLHSHARGQSCYRNIEINKDVKKDGENICNQAKEKLGQLSTSPPTKDQWPTPNPLEIVVTLRQQDDNPDDLAALVESLRYSFGHYSDWTSLPAPLFFERVVRDYISEFHIDDNETEEELEVKEPQYIQPSLF